MSGAPSPSATPTDGASSPPASVGQPCIFVIGMHRSGTSATTGMLAFLGIAVPSEGDRTAPTQWNERGNFESRRLNSVNDRLLLSRGGTWSGPPPLRPGWEGDRDLDGLRSGAGQDFAQSFPSRPMAWKDPRNCLTLPFWRTVVGPPLAAVFVYRDPLEVARSLRARDGVGLTSGLALWDRYVRSACAGLVGLPTMMADYARVLDRPSQWIDELVEFLGSVSVDVEASARRAAMASLDTDLRHQRASVDRTAGLCDSQFAIFDVLRRLDGSHRPWSPPDLGAEPDWVDEVLALRLAADELRRIEGMFRTLRPLRTVRNVWSLRRRSRATGLGRRHRR